ncbi:unnamed protein product [Dovyalis caffra]|uniref:HIT domain-containing protein n=1 Tax=Dovyalis caffra TaxID=77055 RepID=A0AAV1SFZ4_9ROSI|nr:unnamed protein product [Dovyalis caffra]
MLLARPGIANTTAFSAGLVVGNPLLLRHSLIIPKSHFSSLEATPPSVVAAMCSKVPLIGNAIMKATSSGMYPTFFTAILTPSALSLSAYPCPFLPTLHASIVKNVVENTHIHIIPRKACDCLWTTESLQRNPLNFDQEASRLVNCVREQLSNISEDSKEKATIIDILCPHNYTDSFVYVQGGLDKITVNPR